MTEIWSQAALWLGLALVATLASIWLRVATALSEIVVGTIAQLVIGAAFGGALLAGDASWLKFLAGAGAILLTFLAGAELDPAVFRREWKQATVIGLVSFTAPFLGSSVPRTQSLQTRRFECTAMSRSVTPPSRLCVTPRQMASITSSWVTAVTRSLNGG
jgi:Kef-type K+ transport system membrane component KefB